MNVIVAGSDYHPTPKHTWPVPYKVSDNFADVLKLDIVTVNWFEINLLARKSEAIYNCVWI